MSGSRDCGACSRIAVTVVACVALSCALPVQAAALADDVHRLILAERYDAADRRAQAAFDAATGDTPAAIERRIQALQLLLDSANTQYRLEAEQTQAWLDQADALVVAHDGADSSRRAPLLAMAARRALRVSDAAAQRAKAAELGARSLELAQHGRGTLSASDMARVYDAQSSLAMAQRAYDAALSAEQRAEQLTRNTRTPWEQRQHGLAQCSVGLLQSVTGQGQAALASVRAGAAEVARVAGAESLSNASALGFLAQVHSRDGDWIGGRDALLHVLAIHRAHPWLDPKLSDRPLNSLAYIYRRLGDFEHARPLFEEVIARNEVDANGHFDEVLPDTLNTLAGAEWAEGHVARARQLYERALTLEETLFGKTQPTFIEKPLINLVGIALEQGDVAAADAYQKRAEAIDAEDRSGMLRRFVDQDAAAVALAQGDPARAEARLRAELAQLDARHGGRHPDSLEANCLLATALARQNKFDEAYDRAETSVRLRTEILRRVAPALSAAQEVNLKRDLVDCSGVLLALPGASASDARLPEVWQLVADARGLATRLHAARLTAARNASDPDGRARWETWERAAHGYADLLLRASADASELAAARDALDRSESALARDAFGAAPLPIEWLKPPPDTVVVAFVRVDHEELSPATHAVKGRAKDLYAFVQNGASRRLLRLGDADAIGADIERWLRLLRDPASDAAALAASGGAVRAQIWDALGLGVPGRVFVVPDDAVFRVNFALLPDRNGYLIEHGWRVHLLDGENDLALPPPAPDSGAAVLVGAPDFGAKSAPRDPACASGFEPLRGSRNEVDQVAALWRATFGSAPTLLIGAQARKQTLMHDVANGDVVHLSTHAFATQARCAHARADSRGVSIAAGGDEPEENAALALAGANRYFAAGDTDGILSSTEVVTLPLSHTRWVVLAACDTGLGRFVAGEGVFGLRRGFRLAGARTVLMSLWNVNDAATGALMQALYAARWQKKLDTPDALAAAQLAVLAARRARGESTHPYYWGAFVASGDWH